MDRGNIKALNDNIFLLSCGIYIVITLWNQTFLPRLFTGDFYTLIIIFCMLLLIFKEIINIDLKQRYAFIGLMFIFLGVFIYIFSHHKMFFVITFFIFSARNVDVKKIVNTALYISIFVLGFVSICSLAGLIDNQVSIDYITERERYFLGFTYVLFPAAIWSNITCLWMAKRKDFFTWKEVLFFFILNQVLFEYTNARLVYYVVIIRLLAVVIIKTRLKKIFYTSFIKDMLIGIIPLICFFSFYITMNYNPMDTYQYLINFILEGRLELGQDALITYGWPMFGADIQWVGNGLDENGLKPVGVYNYVDCAYIHFLLEYGVCAFVLFMISIMMFMRKMKQENDIIMMVVFATIAIHSMIDDATITLHYNTCLLLFGELISKRKKQEEYAYIKHSSLQV